MSELQSTNGYAKVMKFQIDRAFTYGDTRAGHTDKEKREQMRRAAAEALSRDPNKQRVGRFTSWAFRIWVYKSGRRRFDIENVPKLFVDAFCRRQIAADKSEHKNLGLFDDDTIDSVACLEVRGERIEDKNDEHTCVEIFARRASA